MKAGLGHTIIDVCLLDVVKILKIDQDLGLGEDKSFFPFVLNSLTRLCVFG
jgi:hypothetical protein